MSVSFLSPKGDCSRAHDGMLLSHPKVTVRVPCLYPFSHPKVTVRVPMMHPFSHPKVAVRVPPQHPFSLPKVTVRVPMMVTVRVLMVLAVGGLVAGGARDGVHQRAVHHGAGHHCWPGSGGEHPHTPGRG
jgi:hypothetical protein